LIGNYNPARLNMGRVFKYPMAKSGIRLGDNLAATWIAYCESCGMTRAEALRHLNAATGLRVTHSRLNEWLRGDRMPSREARIAMLQVMLPALLSDHGASLDAGRFSSLARALT
jgi:hypothetical protein